MIHFCVIIGTRPQIIKSQPIINEILKRKHRVTLIHTGQHYDYEMSKIFFEELKIKNPDITLEVKQDSPIRQLSDIIKFLESPLKKLSPDFVIIPGDTRSAFGSSITTNRLGLKVVHIEAGARSGDSTLEEEINRRMIDHSSSYLFAPTDKCFNNLRNEHVLGQVFLSGDTMLDIFLKVRKMLNIKTEESTNILLTIHRKDNLENKKKLEKLFYVCSKLRRIGYNIVFPVHPHTRQIVDKFGIKTGDIKLINPLKYSDMLRMLASAKLVITDSGGLQKEAYWSGVQCLTLRPSTEWEETFEKNHNVLINDLDKFQIKMNLKKFIPNLTLFGNGNASQRIISTLEKI